MDYDAYPRHDVLCVDMRSFYASVECVKRGLDPATALLAVVGDTNRRGSIVLAASPALKKKHGISNVSRYFEIPEDPNIVIAEAHMRDYIEMSIEITKMVHEYVPFEAIHVYSVDEYWIGYDGCEHLYGSPTTFAKFLQRRTKEQFGIECAIGIGENKFLSKVVMDLHAKKSPDGTAECRYEDVSRLLWPFNVEDIWGINTRMMRNLNNMGIVTLGDLATHPLRFLKKRFGVLGEQLYWHAWGVDLSPIFGDFTKTEQKSYGHGITLLRNYSSEEVPTVILDLCEEACRRAREDKKVGRTVHLSIRYSRETGGGFSRSVSMQLPMNATMEMYKHCMTLFHRHYDGVSDIRRVGVSLTNLETEEAVQLSLFDEPDKEKDLADVMDKIRSRYGPNAILRASSFTEAGIARDRGKKIGGHYS